MSWGLKSSPHSSSRSSLFRSLPVAGTLPQAIERVAFCSGIWVVTSLGCEQEREPRY